MTKITSLRIHEMWHTTRTAEPIRVGLPLAEGTLWDVGQLCVTMGGDPLPLQARKLSSWPDGSVRWALLDLQADLDLRATQWLHVYRMAVPGPAQFQRRILLSENAEAIVVDTGALCCAIPRRFPLRLDDVQAAEGIALPSQGGVQLHVAMEEVGALSLQHGTVEVAMHGPLVVEIEAHMPCHAGERHLLDLRALYRFHAGKRTVQAHVTVLSRDRDVQISRLWVTIGTSEGAPVALRTHTRLREARRSETELYYDWGVDAHQDPIWYHDSPEPCWALWQGHRGGVMGSVRNPHLHFPTRIAVSPEGITLDLCPSGEETFHMYPGMAKTQEILVALIPPEQQGYQITLDTALFQRPVRPTCLPGYYAECEAFGRIFPTANKYAAFEGLVATALRNRPLGTGMMHYGDEPNPGYTYEGRGHGELVWTNGEYDTPHLLAMQYARTSYRAWFEAAEAAAMHWMDIDWIRHASDPHSAGGLCCHEGDHRVVSYAGPSHEWTEGLIDYYHLTGYREALRAAESIGDNICRYIEDGLFDGIGTFQLRELGWGLTAIAACIRAAAEEGQRQRYYQAGLHAVRTLWRWVETFGGLVEVSPYAGPDAGDQLLPLSVQRDAFVSLTLNGLNRFYRATGAAEARELFLDQARAQLEWLNSPEGWAEQRETRIPNVEAMGYAYEYTGDRAYLDAAIQILRYALSHGLLRYYEIGQAVRDDSRGRLATYRIFDAQPINAQILGLALIPILAFLETAEKAGVLDQLLEA